MINYMNIGKMFSHGQEDKIKDEIEHAQWETVEPGKTYPMGQGMAVQSAIKEFKIPKVSHVALYGMLSNLGLYGIRGHYKNGTVEIFFVDDGVSLTPVAANEPESMEVKP